MKIWLDDVRPAPDGWEWVKTAEEAIREIETDAALNQGCHQGFEITAISLDHDLGEGVKTGYCVMKCIEEEVEFHDYRIDVYIHSGNPVGRANIQRALDRINEKMYQNEQEEIRGWENEKH